MQKRKMRGKNKKQTKTSVNLDGQLRVVQEKRHCKDFWIGPLKGGGSRTSWTDQQVFSWDRQLEATDGHCRGVVVLGQCFSPTLEPRRVNENDLREKRKNKIKRTGRSDKKPLLRVAQTDGWEEEVNRRSPCVVCVFWERRARFPKNEKGVPGGLWRVTRECRGWGMPD